ncbi:hypothetical protein [endosymbiont GvMRE of Glomus versiforme]|uniref:hypothetical protein n=1 Tax=endosymbiont GvMRE of Glomus versiforme TaxID=2039283 RepID=UPI000EC9ED66|nr:hypothetical protein [endosymbiont GvMRE of Glomus versiforme]RHZ36710.1 hypothetical protein GvMRE_I2g68 [endosymbiont GvMRE of Glomus versiforme]
MPRNPVKIAELQKKINEQSQELAKYKQLIANINGLIKINNGKNPHISDYDLEKEYKEKYSGLTLEQEVEQLVKKLDAQGLQLIIPEGGEYKAIILRETNKSTEYLGNNREQVKELLKREKETRNKSNNVIEEAEKKLNQEKPKSHIDELKQKTKRGKIQTFWFKKRKKHRWKHR